MSTNETNLQEIVDAVVQCPLSLSIMREQNKVYTLASGAVLDAGYAHYLIEYMSSVTGVDLFEYIDKCRQAKQ